MPGLSKIGHGGLKMLDNIQVNNRGCLTEAFKWIKENGGGLTNIKCMTDPLLFSDEQFSHESDGDLASMVREFLENGSSGHDVSCCSSDSDSGTPCITKIAEKIKALTSPETPLVKELLSLIQLIILSKELDIFCHNEGACDSSCIKSFLVKRLRTSGYNAALCHSKWKGGDKVPGGKYEYIDIVFEGDSSNERLIVDVDFQSHFEIARPVPSYVNILKSLPVVYVGTLQKLEKFLELMVEAAKLSLRQNLMPLPPWRTLGYLCAKWLSPHEREAVASTRFCKTISGANYRPITHPKRRHCCEHWRRLKASVLAEVEIVHSLKPLSTDRSKNIQINWRSNIVKA